MKCFQVSVVGVEEEKITFLVITLVTFYCCFYGKIWDGCLRNTRGRERERGVKTNPTIVRTVKSIDIYEPSLGI